MGSGVGGSAWVALAYGATLLRRSCPGACGHGEMALIFQAALKSLVLMFELYMVNTNPDTCFK